VGHTSDALFLPMSGTGSRLAILIRSRVQAIATARRVPVGCIRVNVIAIRCRGCLRSPGRLLGLASQGYSGPFLQPYIAVFALQKEPLVAFTDPSQTPSRHFDE
jgi:hypothetical protein